VGLGALVGSFGLMRLGHSRYVGRIYAGATVFNGLAIVFFALSLQPAYALFGKVIQDLQVKCFVDREPVVKLFVAVEQFWQIRREPVYVKSL